MNEQEWLTCTDPTPMLEWLRGKATDRKMRLFACACCRRMWHLLEDPRSRQAIEVSERFADGLGSEVEVQEAYARAEEAVQSIPDGTTDCRLAAEAASSAVVLPVKGSKCDQMQLAAHVAMGVRLLLHVDPRPDEFLAQCNLLRDLFGNLFRSAVLNSAWLTDVVLSLAQAADHGAAPAGELDPARLAILADALEEAGCNDAEILNHLRGPGPHVRGCWVLDLLLQKA